MQDAVTRLLGVSPSDLAAAAERAAPLQTDGASKSSFLDLNELQTRAQAAQELARLVQDTLDRLAGVEGESEQFKKEIGQLAGDMKQLQTHSMSIHSQLEVRTLALKQLKPLVGDLLVPATVVSEINQGEIGPHWLESLEYVLEKHASAAQTKNSSATEARTFLDELLKRATARAKQWYVNCVRRIRQPGTNAQTVQAELLEFQRLFAFLAKRDQTLAHRVHLAYTNTMRWYYEMLFGKYNRNIDRMHVQLVDKTKTLGALGLGQKSVFTSVSTARSTDVFNIGSRPAVLSSSDQALTLAVVPPVQGYHIEVVLRSLLLALATSMALEHKVEKHAFVETAAGPVRGTSMDESFAPELDLSSEASASLDLPRDNADSGPLFASALVQAAASITRMTHENYDIYGLLLTMRLLQQYGRDYGHVPEFSKFCLARQGELWPRIGTVLDANAKSIEFAAAKASSHRAASQSLPHPMTQLISQLLTGMLQLSADDTAAEEPLAAKIRQLTSAFEMFATKLSKSADQPERFLQANYFVVSAMIADLKGKLAGEIGSHFKLLTEAYEKPA